MLFQLPCGQILLIAPLLVVEGQEEGVHGQSLEESRIGQDGRLLGGKGGVAYVRGAGGVSVSQYVAGEKNGRAAPTGFTLFVCLRCRGVGGGS